MTIDRERWAETLALEQWKGESAALYVAERMGALAVVGCGDRRAVAARLKGSDSLAALVKAEYGADLFSRVVYVFLSKRADRVKLTWWDGPGLCLMAKRLDQGRFRWSGI